MGIAAYNRGSAVIRRQADCDVADIPASQIERSASDNREDMLRTRLASAELDLSKARRLIALLRAEKACLRDELTEERASHAASRSMLSRMFAALGRVRRSWHKASALLRLLPVETVNALRAERDA